MIKNNAKHLTTTLIMVAVFAVTISTISLTSAFAHNPPYKDAYWFNHNGDPEVCYQESELNSMTVNGITGKGAAVKSEVEDTRAEYNSEIDGLTIAAEDSNCSYNRIVVGAKVLAFGRIAQDQTTASWPSPNINQYAESSVDFNTDTHWGVESNACDWFHDKDIEWLANHEFGHALSLKHHSGSGTVMNNGCHSDYASVDSESENALEARY